MEVDELEKRASLVVSEYDGIISYVEAFYIYSIIYSAARCLDSFTRYDKLKSNNGAADELISLVQEAVGHSAALSRYFWPSLHGKKKQKNLTRLKEARGKKLRQAFQLDESSPLYNRDLRNTWEHFDERLDVYLLENNVGFFFPSCILGDHCLADDPTGHIFKLLDVEAECLVLLGDKYFFEPIRTAVQSVYEIALDADKNGSRLRAN